MNKTETYRMNSLGTQIQGQCRHTVMFGQQIEKRNRKQNKSI